MLFLAVISLDSALKKNVHLISVFLKECKYIEKKVVRGIHDSLGDFSYSCDESNERYFFYQRKIKKFSET